MAVTLKYDEYSRVFETMSVRGMEAVGVESFRMFPVAQEQCLDGEIVEDIAGTGRIITIQIGTLGLEDDKTFLFNFIKSIDKSIVYGGNEVTVVLKNSESYEVEYIEECDLLADYNLELVESIIHFDTGTPVRQNVADTYHSIKIKMPVENDESNPKLLIFGEGDLALDDTGHPYPVFSFVTHSIIVYAISYQSCKIMVDNSTLAIVAGKLQVYANRENQGNANNNGEYEYKLLVSCQVK